MYLTPHIVLQQPTFNLAPSTPYINFLTLKYVDIVFLGCAAGCDVQVRCHELASPGRRSSRIGEDEHHPRPRQGCRGKAYRGGHDALS